MPIELKYWNGRGLMEVPRMMLSVSGKEFTDSRLSDPVTAGDTAANLGRMPLLVTEEGECIGQSSAINFYAASVCNFMGQNATEASKILAITEHVKELNTAWRNLVPWGAEPTSDILDKWFDTGATDATGPADGSKRNERNLTWWLGRIENTVGNNFAVGNQLSLADFVLYNILGEFLTDNEVNEGFAEHRRYPFGDKKRTDSKLTQFPKLKSIIDSVANHAHVQKYLAARGPQGF